MNYARAFVISIPILSRTTNRGRRKQTCCVWRCENLAKDKSEGFINIDATRSLTVMLNDVCTSAFVAVSVIRVGRERCAGLVTPRKLRSIPPSIRVGINLTAFNCVRGVTQCRKNERCLFLRDKINAILARYNFAEN